MEFKVIETEFNKKFRSENYNYHFNKKDGMFARWGKTPENDALFSPFGPEILDIEITTKCSGIKGKLCPYCYKSNTPNGDNMSLETFKDILDKVNENNQLTQLAFGLGSTAEENPDLWKMCEYAISKGIVPNGTVADISDETADRIAKYFGACAVSNHGDKDVCYDSVKKLADRGMKQVNIHQVIHSQNMLEVLDLIDDIKNDERLAGLNAVVFLSLKQRGRASKNEMTGLHQIDFNTIIHHALKNEVDFGMDSCSSHKFMNFIKENLEYKQFETFVEPCESFGIFSSYINTWGEYYPCSFMEGIGKWEEGIDVTKIKSFTNEVWNGEKLSKDREWSIANNRNCPAFKI